MNQLPDRSTLSRVAIVGVGNAQLGDDGAGPAVIRRLRQILPVDNQLLIIDAGHAPENILGVIVRFKPDLVLFIDAIRMGREPGQIAIIPSSSAVNAGGSTHTLPLGMLSRYISDETKAQTYIVGIQPASIEFRESISTPVNEAIDLVVEIINCYWRNDATACSAINTGEVSVVST